VLLVAGLVSPSHGALKNQVVTLCDPVWNSRVNVVQPPEATDTRGNATTKTNPTKTKPNAKAANAAKASRLRSRPMVSTLPFRNDQVQAETVSIFANPMLLKAA
jgi:hypothetical protein